MNGLVRGLVPGPTLNPVVLLVEVVAQKRVGDDAGLFEQLQHQLTLCCPVAATNTRLDQWRH